MKPVRAVVLISANIEWRIVLELMAPPVVEPSPLGQWFSHTYDLTGTPEPVIFFHGGWGKIAAAASTQYVLNRWQPELLLNVGTCGGFAGEVARGTLILADETVVYDIIEQMTGYHQALDHYRTRLDLSWLSGPYPQPVLQTRLVSADQDLISTELPRLKAEFGAVAGDWESGAIAWVAARQQTRCLILRGVSDLVDSAGGEAYAGNLHVFVDGTRQIFEKVLPALPQWLALGLAK